MLSRMAQFDCNGRDKFKRRMKFRGSGVDLTQFPFRLMVSTDAVYFITSYYGSILIGSPTVLSPSVSPSV